jgi:hypothetical protein
MFNHNFFEEDLAQPLLQNFFENSKLNSLLVVLDPPFGGLVEVLAASVRKIWKLADCNKDYKGKIKKSNMFCTNDFLIW